MLKDLTSGVIYRNPIAHIRSVHAYFSSCGQLPNGDLVATLSMAEAFEAVDSQLHITRSTDLGETWSDPQPVSPELKDQDVSEFGRVSVIDGRVVLLLQHCDRSNHPNQGLTNPDGLGFVPTQFKIKHATDDSLSNWSEPRDIVSAIEGPCFELCCPITALRDGRWLLPTSTWPDWDGALPNGHRMIALVSHDRGESWPEWQDVFHWPQSPRNYWESKIIELQDGRLLANAWVYDVDSQSDLPQEYTLSEDGGKTWSAPQSMGLHGQTMTPLELSDGRLLNVYRRMDQPGLWAQVSRLDGSSWVNEETQPLWGHSVSELSDRDDSMIDHFRSLRFGAPHLLQLDDGQIFCSFWCYEDCVSIIRYFRFRL